jgi:multiple sugar transport system permease protein
MLNSTLKKNINLYQKTHGEVMDVASLKNKSMGKNTAVAYAFMTPSIILFIVFTVLPFILAFVFSLTDYNGIDGTPSFVGIDNFKVAFQDGFFLSSIKNVFIFALWYVPSSIILSLIIAFLISRVKFNNSLFRIIFYIPALTSGAATVFVWKSLLGNSNTIDFFNGSIFGIPRAMGMFTIIVISLWSGLGGNMLIYLAAMTGIPPELYEAADVDGANKFKQFLFITVPLLRPSTYFIFTTTLIGSFQLFDIVYLLGLYGNDQCISPVVEIYLYGKTFKYGIGSAMSVILFVIIMVVTVITQIFIKENQGEKKLFKRPRSTVKNR